jgi:hypothetical protein
MKSILVVVMLAALKFQAAVTSSSGGSAVVVLPYTATAEQKRTIAVRADALGLVQTAATQADGGFSDGGVFTASANDPLVMPFSINSANPSIDNPAEKLVTLDLGENAVVVAGCDGGTAHFIIYSVH